MVYTIKKSKVPQWGYEITAKGFHNIAPTVDAAVNYLENRFGPDVKYRVKDSAGEMTAERIHEILRETPKDLVLDAGITEFYEEGRLTIGVSYETDPETGKPRHVYNLFHDGEYVNVVWDEDIGAIIDDLVLRWNEYSTTG